MTIVSLPGVQHEFEDFELEPQVLEALWHMEDRHFWHAARNHWILRALAAHGAAPGARVLDVGCGGGCVSTALARHGYQVTGIDTGEILVRKAHERCPSANFVLGNVGDLPPEYGPFDVVMVFDVLEHLDQPEALMADALRRARSGALVVATVPALRSLRTAVDDLMGHKRRYEPGELAALFRATGLQDVEERGIFRAIGPLIREWRRRTRPESAPGAGVDRRRILLEYMRVPGFALNQLLGLVCAAELRFGFAAARGRAGPSLLVTARVP